MTREETSKYTDLMANGKARQFSFDMEAKSVITFPSGEMKLPGPGFYNIQRLGLVRARARAVGRRIGRWRQDLVSRAAGLQYRSRSARFASASRGCWDGKPACCKAAVTDETGYIQPTLKQLIAIRGSNGPFGSIYHLNAIQSWAVNEAGECDPMSTRDSILKAAGLPDRRSRCPLPLRASRAGSYGFGSAATPQELAKFFSIPADGAGLPPGSGNATPARRSTPRVARPVMATSSKAIQRRASAATSLLGGRGTLATKAPIKTVESYWPYATTLFDYVKRAMPFNAPGSLSDDDVYAWWRTSCRKPRSSSRPIR